jgi:hypothetical protein
MRNVRFWIICGILISMLLVGSASAHDTAPLRTINIRVGQYPLVVNYYNVPSAGQALEFTLQPEAALAAGLTYHVTAVPGMTVNAVPVKAVVQPDPDRPQYVSGRVNLPVTGQWLLNIEVNGPRGKSFEDVPILVGPPPVIPESLGWLIGLLPVWGILGFVGWQVRRGARSQHHLVPTP